jgi:hypothetical protein
MAMSVPYLSPAELADAMSDPEAIGIMPMTRDLRSRLGGDDAGLPEIEKLEPIDTFPQPFSRKDLWPAAEWEQMERIRKGEDL